MQISKSKNWSSWDWLKGFLSFLLSPSVGSLQFAQVVSEPHLSAVYFCNSSGCCLLEMTADFGSFFQTPLNSQFMSYPLVTRTKPGCSLTGVLVLSFQVWRTVAPISSWGHWAPWWPRGLSSLPSPVPDLHSNSCWSIDQESHVICSRGRTWWYWKLALKSIVWVPNQL